MALRDGLRSQVLEVRECVSTYAPAAVKASPNAGLLVTEERETKSVQGPF